MSTPVRRTIAACIALLLAAAGDGGAESAPPHGTAVDLARLVASKDFDAAIELGAALLPAVEAEAGPDAEATAEVLDRYAYALYLRDKKPNAEALAMARRALAIRERRHAPDDPLVANSLATVGVMLLGSGEFDAAKALLDRAVAIRETALGPEHALTGTVLRYEAQSIARKGDYAAAKPIFERSCAIAEKTGGPDSFELTLCLSDLGNTLWLLGDYPAAKACHSRALDIRTRTLGPDHLDTASCIGNLAIVLRETGEYAKARDMQRRAIEIRRKALGDRHPWVASGLESLANLDVFLGEYEEAKARYEEIVEIKRRALGPEHAEVAEALNNYGVFLQTLGDYAAARRMHEQALAIRIRVQGPDKPEPAESMTHLATLLADMGDYAAARSMGERALATWEKAVGPEHPRTARALLQLEAWHARTGDLERAETLARRALAIREKQLGPSHVDTAEALEALATVVAGRGDLAAARTLLERASATKTAALGADHPAVARGLVRMGAVLEQAGNLDGAAAAYAGAAAALERKYGPEHPDLSEALRRLGRLRMTRGDFDGAKASLDRALAIREKFLGPDHPLTAESRADRAAWLWGSGAPVREVLSEAVAAEAAAREHFRRTAGALTEAEALRYESIRVSGLDLALAVVEAGGAGAGTAAAQVWDQLVRSRALVLDEMAARRRTRTPQADRNVEAAAEALTVARNRLARLVIAGPDPGRPAEYRARLARLTDERERAERLLLQRSGAYRESRSEWDRGLEDVRRALPPGAAVVAYVVYERPPRRNTSTGSASRIMALVLGAAGGAPVAIPLGRAAEIDGAVEATLALAGTRPPSLASGAREAELRYREVAASLRARIWDPLRTAIGAARLIFVVPDGSLHAVQMGMLPVDGDRYLVENAPSVQVVSAERDLARAGDPGPKGRGLLALGGPDFDEAPADPGAGDGSGGTTLRGRGCSEPGAIRFEPLASARAEVLDLAALWRDGAAPARGSAEVLTGREAGEAAFKRRASGKRVLHLATHGFFTDPDCASALALAKRNAGAEAVAGDNPLLMAGLAFAGANRKREPARSGSPAPVEDGILTAEEIGSLDLSGVEWVVLSACRTGVGRIRNGEGVLGMRRAFETAGIGTLISSLWPVEDDATRRFMRDLYRARLAGRTTSDSMREAMVRAIADRRGRGASTHPFYWGAFVAAGDWR